MTRMIRTGRVSIPANQALIDGLSIKAVYGDMVEGYLLSLPKEEPEAIAEEPKKTGSKGATKSTKPAHGDKGDKDATVEDAPDVNCRRPIFAAV